MKTIDFCIGNLTTIFHHIPSVYILASVSDLTSSDQNNPLGAWYYVLVAVGITITITTMVVIFKYTKQEIERTMMRHGEQIYQEG
mmetsp:Transcript_2047/g.1846  ORF Transcript_2047/g.1846 Transcript_2047/m.1846 type:complete len:85 (+) Transcript_2047:418-672(+)